MSDYPSCDFCGDEAVTYFRRGRTLISIYGCEKHRDQARAMAQDAQNAEPNKTKDWFRPAPERRAA